MNRGAWQSMALQRVRHRRVTNTFTWHIDIFSEEEILNFMNSLSLRCSQSSPPPNIFVPA